MKTQANASVMRKMARTYREFGDIDQARGKETAAAIAHTAADALEDLADTRDDLLKALRIAELANGSANGFDPDRARQIAELRAKHFVIGNG